jgi:hypothetical protein
MTERVHDLIIVGAGPAGIEMGLAAAEAKLDFIVLERGSVADNMARWGFVQLFSPWEKNTTSRGRALCGEDVAADALMSGREFRERYWLPLAASPPLAGRIREGCRVLKAGRAGGFKNTLIGDPSRAQLAFHVLAEESGSECVYRARALVDASGVYGNHRSAGISYELMDLLEDRQHWAGKTIALIGAGYSACTALEQLGELRADGIDLAAHWIYLAKTLAPMHALDDDPLPYRRRLADLGNSLATNPPAWLSVHPGRAVESMRRESDAVQLRLQGETSEIRCDQILAHVGYKPDRSISEELQFHECWATSGPMKLAASLLSQTAQAGADCLAIGDTGPETLKNPEPGFFVLGAKSYGRNSDFLIQRAHAQVEAVLGFLLERASASA